MSRTRILTLVVIFSNVIGNLSLSMGLKAQSLSAHASLLPFLKPFLNPMVLLGVTLLILWMLSRMALMSGADLSYIVPVTAVGYVLSALAGKFVLAEQISATRWLGTLLIMAGAAIVAMTQARTTHGRRSGA